VKPDGATMRRPLQLLWQGARFCAACALSFAVWTLWLALVLLLAGQLYIASTSELEVPGFLLRALEGRLAVSGVRVTFGRTSFDPTGRVLIEDVRASLPAFAEPVLRARAVYAQLDPWALAAGKFAPREVNVIGASLAIPAMLSRSGGAEEILRDLDAVFVPGENELRVPQFSAHIAGVAVSAHGSVYLPNAGTAASSPLPVADFLARNFTTVCRQIDAATAQLAALDQPELHLELAPSQERGAIASVALFARGWRLTLPALSSADGPLPIRISDLRIVTRFPLLGDAPVAAQLEFAARDLALPFDAQAHGVRALIRGTLRPVQLGFEPRELDLSAESFAAAEFEATAFAARLTPGPLPQLEAVVTARLMGAPLAVRASADFKAETATVRFDGAIAPAVLTPISTRLGVDVRKFFDFAGLDCSDGEARLGAGWKFEKLSMRVAVRNIDAYHVHMEEGRAMVEFDGRHLHAPEAWARIGENFARGSYDQDLATRDFRFLLVGRLRPLDISAWFREWWPNFFTQLEFPTAPPDASVDVSGRWGEPRLSAEFVYANVRAPVVRGTALDSLRTRLFIRPGFFDGLEVFATRGPGSARGTFTYTLDPATQSWRQFEFDLASTMDPTVATQMLGPAGAAALGPFAFAQPPAIKLSGRLDGPAAPDGVHDTVNIEARSAGEFRLHDFPLENIAFTAAVHDDDIAVENLRAGFAGGVASGRVKLAGRGADRRVTFDLALKDAGLGRAADTLQQFAARTKGLPPTPPGKFVQEKADVRVDLTVSADGRYADPFSYHGEGNATLQGEKLGEVPLLGLLSELLKFTALRFTTADAKFKIDGAKLTFSEFNLRGANSAIDARGDYALDRRELDFKAKIFPFHESGNLIKSALGAVLSPLSSVFEVILNGTLDKPKWSLVLGPTNFLRSLVPGESPPAAKPDAPAEEKPDAASAPKP
jgi:hypothetical protein